MKEEWSGEYDARARRSKVVSDKNSSQQESPQAVQSSGKIFLSYRRDDAAADAFFIFDQLNVRFPGRVFRDVSTVEPGADFVNAIDEAVRASKVLVALIGRQWLSIADASGQRRLDDPRDFVRLEIASALQQKIAVIPVLLRGARMPSFESLPADIAALGRRQALEISEGHFEQDVEQLVRLLERQLGETAGRVKLLGMANNSGWLITLDIADAKLKEIWYRLDNQTEFKSTGFGLVRRWDTGLPQPQYQFQLFNVTESQTIHVKYATADGVEHGPYELEFDPRRELVRETKHVLELTKPWLSFVRHFTDDGESLLVHFSHLVSYKNAFRRIRYSVDDDSLSSELRFTPNELSGHATLGEDDETYITISAKSHYVSVKVCYIDGSESPVEKIVVNVDAPH